MLPSFIIIGAMKAGTSSLYHYLDAHPQIGMSTIKETNFFLGDGAAGRDLGWYQGLFAGDARIYGEASPNYAKRHLHPDVPARIHALIPDAKLIYVVRDPIDRLVSHYVHNLTQGRERRSLPAALAHLEASNLVLTSRYFYQLTPFLRYFPPDRILIFAMEDLSADKQQLLERIYRFLGIDPYLGALDPRQVYNSSLERRKAALLDQRVPNRFLKRLVRRALPAGLLAPILPPAPSLREADRARLTAYLAPDVEQLRRFTGERFGRWSL